MHKDVEKIVGPTVDELIQANKFPAPYGTKLFDQHATDLGGLNLGQGVFSKPAAIPGEGIMTSTIRMAPSSSLPLRKATKRRINNLMTHEVGHLEHYETLVKLFKKKGFKGDELKKRALLGMGIAPPSTGDNYKKAVDKYWREHGREIKKAVGAEEARKIKAATRPYNPRTFPKTIIRDGKKLTGKDFDDALAAMKDKDFAAYTANETEMGLKHKNLLKDILARGHDSASGEVEAVVLAIKPVYSRLAKRLRRNPTFDEVLDHAGFPNFADTYTKFPGDRKKFIARMKREHMPLQLDAVPRRRRNIHAKPGEVGTYVRTSRGRGAKNPKLGTRASKTRKDSPSDRASRIMDGVRDRTRNMLRINSEPSGEGASSVYATLVAGGIAALGGGAMVYDHIQRRREDAALRRAQQKIKRRPRRRKQSKTLKLKGSRKKRRDIRRRR